MAKLARDPFNGYIARKRLAGMSALVYASMPDAGFHQVIGEPVAQVALGLGHFLRRGPEQES